MITPTALKNNAVTFFLLKYMKADVNDNRTDKPLQYLCQEITENR